MNSYELIFPGDMSEDGRTALDTPRRVVEALCKARFAGQRVEWVCRGRKSTRTLRANAALHAGLAGWAAHKGLTGEAARAFVEDIKDDLLALCFGYVVRQNQLTGEVTKRLTEPHTAKLTVEQFSELFDVALVEAAKAGYLWTLPDEFTAPKKGAA